MARQRTGTRKGIVHHSGVQRDARTSTHARCSAQTSSFPFLIAPSLSLSLSLAATFCIIERQLRCFQSSQHPLFPRRMPATTPLRRVRSWSRTTAIVSERSCASSGRRSTSATCEGCASVTSTSRRTNVTSLVASACTRSRQTSWSSASAGRGLLSPRRIRAPPQPLQCGDRLWSSLQGRRVPGLRAPSRAAAAHRVRDLLRADHVRLRDRVRPSLLQAVSEQAEKVGVPSLP